MQKQKRYLPDEQVLRDLPARPTEKQQNSRSELARALAALSEAQREVLLARYVDGMTLAEIAGALDIPLGTVKSRLHNALRRLREDGRTRKYFLE